MREAFKKPIPERGCKSLNLQLRFSIAATFEKHFLKEQNYHRELLLQIRRKLDLRSRLHGDLPRPVLVACHFEGYSVLARRELERRRTIPHEISVHGHVRSG